MKKTPYLKSLIWLFALLFVVQAAPAAFAHNSSQSGILDKTYIPKYGNYYIGGDNVGWSIDENFHTNGTIVTYSFTSDPNLAPYKAMVIAGANKWNGTVSIVQKTDGSGTGKIYTSYKPGESYVARFVNYRANSSGHLTTWDLEINRAKTHTATTFAHEFGHAIGLNDLYGIQSKNKLMYGYTSGTATAPTAADKWGAKVITGVHTAHTWGGYTYHSTNSNGNKHAKCCTLCNGISLQVEYCTYNANNVCTKCGIPKGVQPYSMDDPLVLES